MALDQAQQRLLIEWMERKKISTQCPACDTSHDWLPGDIVAAPVFKPGGLHLGSDLTPMVEIICDNCGYVRFFAAAPIGLYEKRGQDERCEDRGRAQRKADRDKPFTISA
ncbi:MAG TPA: hypothetical protein VJ183_03770 [Chloroflexia bacterium]|nr:hypothetical protein [Chloroflexia bacterium]